MNRFLSRNARRCCSAIALAVLFLPVSGCEQLFQQRAERQRDAAQKKYNAGDFTKAVALYEASLDGSQKTAEIHYTLGLIYDDKLAQPISAMHHFRRYLELAPEGDHRKDAANFIKEDQLKLSASLGNGATVPQHEAARLKNDNLALRKQVLELRAELEAASKARVAALKSAGGRGSKGQEQVQKTPIPGVRIYTVVPGDTLASISRKFYKTPGRWKDLQDANFNTLEGTAKLKPGMKLMIP